MAEDTNDIDDFAQQSDPESTDLKIELSEAVADGQYANLVMVGHSSEEFVLDFILVMPGIPRAKVKTRIILTPRHAKRMLHALGQNIEKFEHANGEIPGSPVPEHLSVQFGGGQVGEA
ncbi:MAG: DUF3467 domain-containing protein [Bacteroidota bacterium]|nr:DUF3467 domain-containing protein [Bacteroidota bacterium]